MSLLDLDVFTKTALELGRERFLEAYPCPALVIAPFRPLEESGFWTTEGARTDGGAMETVALLQKREGANKFGSMITIGRAGTADIRVNASGVSKQHAMFVLSGGKVYLADAGSTNGTHVGGKRLRKRERVELEPGDTLRIGELQASFHSPETLFAFLEKHADDSRGS